VGEWRERSDERRVAGKTTAAYRLPIMRVTFSSHERYTLASAEIPEAEINGNGGAHASRSCRVTCKSGALGAGSPLG
jgi:hypothetical protein